MSLLLKALKQAEASNAADKSDADKSRTGKRIKGDLELEPRDATGTAQPSDWVEPPSLLFGSSGLTPKSPQRSPAFRWPRLSLVPLTALLAALIALGYGVYLYFALQPTAAVEPAPVSVEAPAVAPITPGSPAMVEPAPAALPATLPAAPVPQTNPASIRKPAPVTALPETDRRPPRPAAATRSGNPPAALPLFQPDAQNTLLSQAYAAYQLGAISEAQRLYTQAAASGRNVDALLGLAAIASVQNREADAQRLYREVLDLDPRNATAQGALLDLLGNTDSQATESRLKALIERDPSPQLYQTLGNLYADQGRWNDAQVAYFEAYRGAPGNADYAYNLAVSLDMLRQPPAALIYYEKALALGGAHRFDRVQAETRIRQLKAVL